MLKLVSQRTVFFSSPYNTKTTKWSRNKIYSFIPVDSLNNESLSICGRVETDMILKTVHHGIQSGEKYFTPITYKELKKYFITIEVLRERKISQLLNNKDKKNDFI